MAQIEEGGGGRETNVELNLVPFIDLMSVCIIFLLITAVWVQVSMIQIGSSVYGKKSERIQEEVPQKEITPFRLSVKAAGYIVRTERSEAKQIPKINGKYDDQTLLAILRGFRDRKPDSITAIISMDETLTYENLIHGMDMLMAGGFSEISVATAD